MEGTSNPNPIVETERQLAALLALRAGPNGSKQELTAVARDVLHELMSAVPSKGSLPNTALGGRLEQAVAATAHCDVGQHSRFGAAGLVEAAPLTAESDWTSRCPMR